MRDEEEIDFLILNPRPVEAPGALPAVLEPDHLRRVARAIVVVKGWHTETFGRGRLERTPSLFRFADADIEKQARAFFGDAGKIDKVLILPALPQEEGARARSLALLKAKGVDAVISFRTMLADLIAHTEPNRNYQKSDLLQTIRVLKQYDLFREAQMELFKTRRPGRRSSKRLPAPPADLTSTDDSPGGTS
ncbi:MAG: hypothetical protein KA191_02350 [Verrucomicrobia bacterium]|nr:hypothetical protein [Verrucomicrobiota bacterium]MDI9381466.1 hypothetical protein [Verrucomicrobiota bacterium]NMD19836.1 hypothetical protein [Verrucomicrobiota bacterium]HQJ99383.1 hypothetical protein [Verrucomicrobiota bacterium]